MNWLIKLDEKMGGGASPLEKEVHRAQERLDKQHESFHEALENHKKQIEGWQRRTRDLENANILQKDRIKGLEDDVKAIKERLTNLTGAVANVKRMADALPELHEMERVAHGLSDAVQHRKHATTVWSHILQETYPDLSTRLKRVLMKCGPYYQYSLPLLQQDLAQEKPHILRIHRVGRKTVDKLREALGIDPKKAV